MIFRAAAKWVRGLFPLALVILLLLFPQAGMDGVSQGLSCCVHQIIPALFPFFVVTNLVLNSPAAHFLGLGLLPITKGLGLSGRDAPAALLLCWLGGFAAAARCVSQLYQQHRLPKRQAEFLLICAVGSSPAFIINTVGLLMLHSSAAGLLLTAALLLANLFTALLCRPFFHFQEPISASVPDEQTRSGGLVDAVHRAIDATLTVCGFVVFFRFLGVVLGQLLPQNGFSAFLLNALLEVTSGCQAGAVLPQGALYACCAALSIQSLSVLLQVRALLCSELSIRPLLWARGLHLVLSLAFLKLLTFLFPLPAPVYSSLAPRVFTRSHAPLDAAALLFLLCCVVLHRLEQAFARKQQ